MRTGPDASGAAEYLKLFRNLRSDERTKWRRVNRPQSRQRQFRLKLEMGNFLRKKFALWQAAKGNLLCPRKVPARHAPRIPPSPRPAHEITHSHFGVIGAKEGSDGGRAISTGEPVAGGRLVRHFAALRLAPLEGCHRSRRGSGSKHERLSISEKSRRRHSFRSDTRRACQRRKVRSAHLCARTKFLLSRVVLKR